MPNLNTDFASLKPNPTSEQLAQILCQQTQSSNPHFFRISIAYYFAKIASMMRCKINTHDRGLIPVNIYAINLATSGDGKGHSTNILEEEVISSFRREFLSSTFLDVSERNLMNLAVERAARKQTEPDDELVKVQTEFDSLGALAFSFDSGTTPALKQMRHKLLMANAGSINMEIDEIGLNLLGNSEVINSFLELYDVGKIKQKLTKNTSESVRSEEIEGKTPTNMLLFGTPDNLFDGGQAEDKFVEMLVGGYGRRCFFSYSDSSSRDLELTAEQIYDMLTSSNSSTFICDLNDRLGRLAREHNFDTQLVMSKENSILLIEYKLHCEARAAKMNEYARTEKAEMAHRFFKVLKLAGIYAFIEGETEVTEDCIYAAIKLAEESGEKFHQMMKRDRNYVKLAKYLATIDTEVTNADLVADLPFYKGSNANKKELMDLASAWSYKNNIVLKRSFSDGIEFFSGESLEETNLDELILSYSDDWAYNYEPAKAPFDQLGSLTLDPSLHWCNHAFVGGHREGKKAIPGFNMIVLDVDGTCSLEDVRDMFSEYTYYIYTTKRHTEEKNRFRVVMPINYILKLEDDDYVEFMNNIMEWLPFEVDSQVNQRARKWMSNDGDDEYNYGKLLDVLPFIPKTPKNEERKQSIQDLQSLSNLERWFVMNTVTGNRSNNLVRYALMLVDSGMDYPDIEQKVISMNKQIADSMDDSELKSTVLRTAYKKFNS